MKTFKLMVFIAGERLSKGPDAEVKGFANAERKADELLEKYIHNYTTDTYVVCVENEYDMEVNDYLCWQEDCYDERYWKMMENGCWGPIGLRLLTAQEQEELNLLREEKEVHIWDLDEDQLKKLRCEICVGSCYYSDYENSFGIDTHEVAAYSDSYCKYIESEGLSDTAKEFAEYIIYG